MYAMFKPQQSNTLQCDGPQDLCRQEALKQTRESPFCLNCRTANRIYLHRDSWSALQIWPYDCLFPHNFQKKYSRRPTFTADHDEVRNDQEFSAVAYTKESSQLRGCGLPRAMSEVSSISPRAVAAHTSAEPAAATRGDSGRGSWAERQASCRSKAASWTTARRRWPTSRSICPPHHAHFLHTARYPRRLSRTTRALGIVWPCLHD